MNADTAESLLAELEHLGAQLRGHAETIAAELARGPEARIAQVDILRPHIMRLIAQLNDAVRRCGDLHGGDRGNALTEAMNFYRPQPGFWAQCDRLLRLQLPPRARPLVREHSDEPTLGSAQGEASNILINVLHFALKAPEQSAQARALGCHDDIPLAPSTFFAAAHVAYRVLLAQGCATGARFLDVGCGNGMKLLSAAPFFAQCDGLEYQDTSVQAARELMARAQAFRCDVFEGDALTFEGYDAYEVIYFFRPLRDADTLCQMEDRIIANASPGTVLIAPYFDFHRRAAALGCGRITDDVFVTDTGQDDADALRKAAEFTGLSLPKAAAPTPSLWDTILKVSAARGFVPTPSSERYVM